MLSPFRSLALAATLLPLAAPAQGEELHRPWLAPDARWVVHLDVDAVRASVLGQAAQAWLTQDPRLARHLEALQTGLPLDPLQDLHGVTLFGGTRLPDSTVLILTGGPALDGLLPVLEARPRHRLRHVEDLVFHAFPGSQLPGRTQSGEAGVPLLWLGRAGDPGQVGPTSQGAQRTLVLTDRADLLVAAVRRVQGQGPSLVTQERPLLTADPVAGCTLYLEAGRGLSDLLGRLPSSRLVSQARRARVMLGETDGRAWARLRLATASPESSRDAADVLRALVQLLRAGLASGLAPELAARADDIRVEEHRRDVLVGFRGDAGELARELRGVLDRLLEPAPGGAQ